MKQTDKHKRKHKRTQNGVSRESITASWLGRGIMLTRQQEIYVSSKHKDAECTNIQTIQILRQQQQGNLQASKIRQRNVTNILNTQIRYHLSLLTRRIYLELILREHKNTKKYVLIQPKIGSFSRYQEKEKEWNSHASIVKQQRRADRDKI